MPHKNPEQRRKSNREAQQRRRNRLKAAATPPRRAMPPPPSDPAGALAVWSKSTLVIPPGHPNTGQPLVLPDYGVDFLRDALAAQESLLSIGRKNAKSAIVGVYLLGRLVGPLRVSGYRAGVVSVNREKAGELWRQCEAIAESSGLEGLTFRRAPMRIVGPDGDVDILSADKSAGHASGFDDAVFDEIGLIPERGRELVNGIRSAVSARNGRFLALSIQGDAPFTAELLDRQNQPGVAVHHYAAPDGCALDDPAGWYAANPGLGVIKSLDYMRHAAARALAVPADAAAFRAYDLNQPQSPGGQTLVSVDDWRAVETDDLPAADGPMVLGADLSSGYAMSAVSAFWPLTGRLQGLCAFPELPDLKTRGDADGVGSLYQQMAARSELITTPGRTVDVPALLHAALAEYGRPTVVVCDRWRLNELTDALDAAGITANVVTRGMGWQDGSEDVRGFQRAVQERRIATPVSLAARSAFSGATVMLDPAGNAKLCKSSQGGRRARHKDDLAAAMVLAVAEGRRNPPKPRRSRYLGLVG